MLLPKSDPPLGIAGVVRVGAFAPSLPKFIKGPGILMVGVVRVGALAPSLPKGPGILIVEVAGAVVVALGRVGVGNVPKNEEGLVGSVNTKISVEPHSGEIMPNIYPFLCFP